MTSADVYWILMLDNIRNLVETFGIFSTVALVLLVIVGIVAWCDDAALPLAYKIGVPLVVLVWVTSLVACALVPSTKQAAVIYMLPKVATAENIETVQGETGELYGLAKQWLQAQVTEQGIEPKQ